MSEEKRIENIPIQKIIPNIYQPRIKFDSKSIMELANSIKKHGIIQPLILREVDNAYEIIDGERRYKAAKKIGLKTIPSIILDIDDKDAAELILTENMQKQLLSPIEEANAYQQIMLLNKFDIKELAQKLEKSESVIENKLKLLTLPTQIQEALLNNKIAEGHARALTKVSSKAKKLELFNKVLQERITVKTLEELIKKEENNKLDDESTKDNVEIDTISLNDLNKKDFLTTKRKDKMEDDKMDNTQMNFNQYNNLLKEKDIPQVGVVAQPEPIIGNNGQNQKTNDFFPSLEEQPLNFDIPVSEEQNINNPVQMPQFEMPMTNMAMPEQMIQTAMPTMEVSQMNNMPESVQMPQFEMPMTNMAMPEQMMQPAMPTMEVPQMNNMPESAQMPKFEMPMTNMAMPEPTFQPAMPTMEVPQMNVALEQAQMPQFEMPVFNSTTTDQNQLQSFVTPEAPASIENNTNKVITNVMPAVNMIRNLIPLLENSGYKINIEETDNPNEYQVILKVEK